MQAQLEEAYQKAVALADTLKAKGMQNLTDAEKAELEKTLRSIEQYNQYTERDTMIMDLP